MTQRPASRLPAVITALAVLLAGCSQSAVETSVLPSESASHPEGATITPSSAASASASASASATLSWSEEEFSGAVDGVVAYGGGYVAVGTVDRVPTAWTSADGESWEPHAVPYEPPPGDLPGMPGPRMGNLAEHDGWLYAIGAYQGAGDGISPLGWRSQDGRTWEQIVSQNPFYTEGYVVSGLVSGAPGLLALTHGFAFLSGGVWLWTPETSWVEVTDALPGTAGGAEFSDASWADGRYVVVGQGNGGSDSRGASTWTSTDGRNWQMNVEPYPWESNGERLGVVTAVAPAFDSAWSAFLMAPGRPVALYSTDASSWEVSQDLLGTWLGSAWNVANVGDRLIAAGGDAGRGNWVIASSDGRTWDESYRTDRGQAPMFDTIGGPAIASNGSSILVFWRFLEPATSQDSLLLRTTLP